MSVRNEIDAIDALMWAFTKMKTTSTTRYIDWEKAKGICQQYPNAVIYAGLRGDMGNTGGIIYDHGEWKHEYVYDRSTWATPILEIYPDDYVEDEIKMECWTTEPHEYNGVPEWWGK